MGRLVSLNARVSANAAYTDQIPVMLVTIRHPALTVPARLSTDPTQRTSLEPLKYGTRHTGDLYDFALVSAVLPDDQRDAPPKTTLVFENVDRDMAAPLRAIPPGTFASVDLVLVLAGSPDVIEWQATDMRGVRGGYDASQVTLEISREPFTGEPWPAQRMTKSRTPGLFTT